MWKILSIFPPTYFTIKTTAGGHELERQGISVLPHFPIYCLVFFWATSFTSSTFRGLTCQALCYLYSFLAKKKAFPMRLNSQWTWASGSWINSWQTRNTWGCDMMSLFELISGKISENSIPLGMLLHQALHCAENKWPRAYDDGLEDGLRSCSSWKWIFAPSWAHWPNMQLGTNPNMHLSRKTSYIIETGKGRTRKGKKHFLKLKTVQND